MYIDGSGGNKNNPDTGTWAVAVLSANGFRSDEYYNDKYHGAIGGKVVADLDHPAFIGASIATNNTGEISSMIWALLFVISHSANSQVNHFYNIHYDSDFSAGSVFKFYNIMSHPVLARIGLALYHICHNMNSIVLTHIKSHTNHPWNELADCI